MWDQIGNKQSKWNMLKNMCLSFLFESNHGRYVFYTFIAIMTKTNF